MLPLCDAFWLPFWRYRPSLTPDSPFLPATTSFLLPYHTVLLLLEGPAAFSRFCVLLFFRCPSIAVYSGVQSRTALPRGARRLPARCAGLPVVLRLYANAAVLHQ